MKILKITSMAAVAGLALALSSSALLGADRDARGQLAESDYKFVKEAARGGTLEVELGDLAHQKGVSQSVRTFGERMAADHKKANDELKEIATRKGATLPAELSHGENFTMTHLQKATGADFDKSYAAHMVKDHESDVKDFQAAAKDLKDPDLRAFAQKTLPVLEEHLRMARELDASVKK